MFHVATKRLFQEILDNSRDEQRHIYRGNKKKLGSMIKFFGLFFSKVYKDEKGYYITSPFDLDLVIDYTKKIRDWTDKQGKDGVGRVLFSNKQYNRIQNSQRKTKREIITRVIL